MSGSAGVILKMSVQRDYNTFLYGALPLCVVLANGLSQWHMERFVELYCYYGDDCKAPELDMCDASGYAEVLDTVTLDRASAANDDIIDFLRGAADTGRYVTVFVDVHYLDGVRSSVFVHECLVYGYDDTARQLAVVGFDRDRRFTAQRVGYERFRTALSRAVTATAPGGPFSAVTSLVQSLTPGPATPAFSPARLAARLRRYRDCTPVVPSMPLASVSYWWISGPPNWAPGGSQHCELARFGLAVYDDLDRYVSLAADRSDGSGTLIDYRVFHLLAEHKRSVMRRLRLLSDLPGAPAGLSPLLSGWDGLVRHVDTLRLRMLRRHTSGNRLIPGYTGEMLRWARKTEADLLDRLCDQLDLASTMN